MHGSFRPYTTLYRHFSRYLHAHNFDVLNTCFTILETAIFVICFPVYIGHIHKSFWSRRVTYRNQQNSLKAFAQWYMWAVAICWWHKKPSDCPRGLQLLSLNYIEIFVFVVCKQMLKKNNIQHNTYRHFLTDLHYYLLMQPLCFW